MSIYLLSLSVFLSVVLLLVFVILLLEAKLVQKGDRKIVINENPDKTLHVLGGVTLPLSHGLLLRLSIDELEPDRTLLVLWKRA